MKNHEELAVYARDLLRQIRITVFRRAFKKGSRTFLSNDMGNPPLTLIFLLSYPEIQKVCLFRQLLS